MVARSINWKKHFITLIITLIIFVVGLSIGIKLSDERIQHTKNVATEQRLDYESLQLQFLYLDKNSEDCDLLLLTLEQNLYDLEQQRVALEQYISTSNDEEYELIQKEYILTEIRYWILANDAKTFCDTDFVPVLYFYLKEEDCDLCSTQGHILNFIKDKLKEKALIFSFDAASDEHMVELLMNTFDITDTPSVVVGDIVYTGLTTKEMLLEDICSSLSATTPFCATPQE